MALIGRKEEIEVLERYYASDNSEFIALYGRRRIGKTYLVNELFGSRFSFQVTGQAKGKKREQLTNFRNALVRYSGTAKRVPTTWQEAFEALISYLEMLPTGRKLLFFDELPWMDTSQSGFLSALEHFWNGWAALRHDIMLIVCGSATSWMTNKLINDHGGLHNRVTRHIHLAPFTLRECELFLQKKAINWPRKQVAEAYMILGGVPYYWGFLEPTLSLPQNIDRLFFGEQAVLAREFDNLYASLFSNSEAYIKVVRAISKRACGLTRTDILREAKLPAGGNVSRVLSDLENCHFIRRYSDYGHGERNPLYQLTDPYTLFYFHFLQKRDFNDDEPWLSMTGTPKHNAWVGYAFEQLCLLHFSQIKKALGISGVGTKVAAWRGATAEGRGAQIDMVIDRRDGIINLCEIKFYHSIFTVTRSYRETLERKLQAFREDNQKTLHNKAVMLTLITTYGVTTNQYVADIHFRITMDELFG